MFFCAYCLALYCGQQFQSKSAWIRRFGCSLFDKICRNSDSRFWPVLSLTMFYVDDVMAQLETTTTTAQTTTGGIATTTTAPPLITVPSGQCKGLFLTNGKVNLLGNNSNLVDFDALCVASASRSIVSFVRDRAPYYVALFSNTTLAAYDRVPNDASCFAMPNGVWLFANKADIFDSGPVPVSIVIDENGSRAAGDCCVWTGTAKNGRLANTGGLSGVCPSIGGTDNQGNWALWGDVNNWLYHGPYRFCSNSAPIYCIDVGPVVPSTTLAPTTATSLVPTTATTLAATTFTAAITTMTTAGTTGTTTTGTTTTGTTISASTATSAPAMTITTLTMLAEVTSTINTSMPTPMPTPMCLDFVSCATCTEQLCVWCASRGTASSICIGGSTCPVRFSQSSTIRDTAQCPFIVTETTMALADTTETLAVKAELPIAAIAGGAAGGLLLILASIGVCVWLSRRQKSNVHDTSLQRMSPVSSFSACRSHRLCTLCL